MREQYFMSLFEATEEKTSKLQKSVANKVMNVINKYKSIAPEKIQEAYKMDKAKFANTPKPNAKYVKAGLNILRGKVLSENRILAEQSGSDMDTKNKEWAALQAKNAADIASIVDAGFGKSIRQLVWQSSAKETVKFGVICIALSLLFKFILKGSLTKGVF